MLRIIGLFLRYSASNNDATLKSVLGVVQDHSFIHSFIHIRLMLAG